MQRFLVVRDFIEQQDNSRCSMAAVSRSYPPACISWPLFCRCLTGHSGVRWESHWLCAVRPNATGLRLNSVRSHYREKTNHLYHAVLYRSQAKSVRKNCFPFSMAG